MKLNTVEKETLFQTFGHKKSPQDSGSPESQIALFTHKIKHLTDHLGKHKKDCACRKGLQALVGQRKGQLAYLKREDIDRYKTVIASLGLRK